MPEGVRISVDFGTGELSRALKRGIDLGENLKPLLSASGGLIEESIDRRFDTSAGPGGIPWPPSNRAKSAAVPKRGARKFGPLRAGKTLVNTGKLRASMTSEVGDTEVRTGVDGANLSSKYAATHQFGATIEAGPGKFLVFTGSDGGLVFAKKVTIPARPFVGFDDQDVADIDDLWTEALKGAFNGN